MSLPAPAKGHVDEGQKVRFGFRADSLMPVGHGVENVEDAGQIAMLDLNINLTEPLGTETLLFVEIGGVEVQSKMLNPRPVGLGEKIKFQLVLDKCHVFDAKTGDVARI